MLYTISLAVELIAFLVAVGLGLYLITRSPHRPESWLAALTSWSMGGLFLNMLFSLSPPALPEWMVWLLVFWPKGIFAQDPNAWLQGWSSTISPAFWYHATVLMISRPIKNWQRFLVGLSYILAVIVMLIQSRMPETYNTIQGDPLFLNALQAGPIYGYSLGALTILCSLSIWNLILAGRSEPRYLPRLQLFILSAATLLASLTGPVGLLAAFLKFTVPMFMIALFMGTGLLVTGLGVARYSALLENRGFAGDIYHMFFSLSLITGLYMGTFWTLGRLDPFPNYYYVFIGYLVVITHTLYDYARQQIDFNLFQHEKHLLRGKLHLPAGESGQDRSQELTRLLENICKLIQTSYGVILVQKNGEYIQDAAFNWNTTPVNLPPNQFAADDFKTLQPGELPDPFAKAVYLFPIFRADKQTGALVLGPAEHGLGYSPFELDGLQEFSDYLGVWLDHESSPQIVQPELSDSKTLTQRLFSESNGEISIPNVETALRNLNNYSRLAELPLSGIELVRQRSGTNPSHIDTGKAVHAVLHEAVELLHPSLSGEAGVVNGVWKREWYPYIILRDAYINNLPNRKIMNQLYISEGTFNRTRRAAIRSLTQLLMEMERKVPQ